MPQSPSSLRNVWLYVAAGGAIGAILRAGIISCAEKLAGPEQAFIGTMICNIAGSFVLAFVAVRLLSTWRTGIRVGLTVGLIGSFTTFSTLGADTLVLVRAAGTGLALLYPVGSAAAGCAAAWGGWLLASKRTAAVSTGGDEGSC